MVMRMSLCPSICMSAGKLTPRRSLAETAREPRKPSKPWPVIWHAWSIACSQKDKIGLTVALLITSNDGNNANSSTYNTRPKLWDFNWFLPSNIKTTSQERRQIAEVSSENLTSFLLNCINWCFDSDLDLSTGLQFHFLTIAVLEFVVNANLLVQIFSSLYCDLRLFGVTWCDWFDDLLHDSGKRNGGLSARSVLTLINSLLLVRWFGHAATSFRAGGFTVTTIVRSCEGCHAELESNRWR